MNWNEINRREETSQNEIQISETESTVVTYTTIFTLIEYDFDGIKVTVDIPHFMPPDESYIILGIENRAITEQRKLGLIP